MSNNIYVVYAKRTPIGKFGGSLKSWSASDLQARLIKDACESLNIGSEAVDEVIVGHVLSAGQGQGVARQASLKGGLDHSVVAYSVNMVCGSGMKSIMLACTQIQSNQASLIFAGGSESMSQAPYLMSAQAREGQRLGNFEMIDSLVYDGLTDAFDHQHMGITAERVAQEYQITREQQDDYSLESQAKAIAAIDQGKFKDEIVALEVKLRKETVIVEEDEYVNRTTNSEKLARLKSSFIKDGTVTAGNASGINDGASLLVLADEHSIELNHLTPLVRVVAYAQVGIDPKVMGLGPIKAIEKALAKANLNLLDIDLYEMNEAFAAQSLAVLSELSKHDDQVYRDLLGRTNVNGGAIALGHPIGSSGNRICVSLIHEMIKQNVKYGCASLCIGGGMGTAIIFERI